MLSSKDPSCPLLTAYSALFPKPSDNLIVVVKSQLDCHVPARNKKSLVRGKLQQPPVGTVLDHPDGAILVHADAAHALAHRDALSLACALAVDGHAHDALGAKPSNERVALPLGEQVALVDDQTGGRDDGDPEGFGGGKV